MAKKSTASNRTAGMAAADLLVKHLRIIAVAFALGLFILSNIVSADITGDFIQHFGGIFANHLSGWQWYAVLAISICFFFNIIVYMAGKALMSESLQRYALSEFMQVTASALMIAFAAQLMYSLATGSGMDLMVDVIGSNSVVACGAAPNGVFSIWQNDPNFGVGPLGAFRCKLQEKITALDGAYDKVYEGNKMNEVWASTCIMFFGIPV